MDGTTDKLLYLARGDVEEACSTFDVVSVVRDALVAHERGASVLPDEAYLAWTTPTGGRARSLGMPGWLQLDAVYVGTKVINANPANVERARPRAAGLTVLFDPETAAPVAIMEAARISSVRTAAVSLLGIEALHGRPPETVAIVGCGVQAAAHLELLGADTGAAGCGPAAVRLHDRNPAAADRLATTVAPVLAGRISVAATAEGAIREADVVITTTTVTSGYVPMAWLAPGCYVSHVSLDDLLPDVLLGCDRLYVDSVGLVAADDRRILGRLLQAGVIGRPGDVASGARRCIDAQLGAVLGGSAPAPAPGETVVLNPFGMAIEDIAVAGRIFDAARERGLGTWVDR